MILTAMRQEKELANLLEHNLVMKMTLLMAMQSAMYLDLLMAKLLVHHSEMQ